MALYNSSPLNFPLFYVQIPPLDLTTSRCPGLAAVQDSTRLSSGGLWSLTRAGSPTPRSPHFLLYRFIVLEHILPENIELNNTINQPDLISMYTTLLPTAEYTTFQVPREHKPRQPISWAMKSVSINVKGFKS